MINDSELRDLAWAIKDLLRLKNTRDTFLNQLKSFKKWNDQWDERQRLEIKYRNHRDRQMDECRDQWHRLVAKHRSCLSDEQRKKIINDECAKSVLGRKRWGTLTDGQREEIIKDELAESVLGLKRWDTLDDESLMEIFRPLSLCPSPRSSSPWQDCRYEVEKGTHDDNYWDNWKEFYPGPGLSPSQKICLYYVRLSILHDKRFKDDPDFTPLTRGILDGGHRIELENTWKVMRKDPEWCYRLKETLEAVRTDLVELLKTENKESTDADTSAELLTKAKLASRKGRSKKNDRGRPRVSDDRVEVERRRNLKSKWEQYQSVGLKDASKPQFCLDKGISVAYLNDSVLRWCREHPE